MRRHTPKIVAPPMDKKGGNVRSASRATRQARQPAASSTGVSAADGAGVAHRLNTEEVLQFRDKLLGWFLRYRRRLPWRGDPPPFSTAAETKSASIRVRAAEEARSEKRAVHQSHCGLDRWIKTPMPKGLEGTASSGSGSEQRATAGVEKAGGCHVETRGKYVSPGSRLGKESSDSEANTGTEEETFGVSAYGVWISEVMLQQTQVAVVLPYWIQWKRRWPTLLALAAACEEAVREAWAGLGYYQRAMRLLQAARHIVWNWYQAGGKQEIHLEGQPDVERDVDAIPAAVFKQLFERCREHKGPLWDVPFPRESVEALKRLPGIGAYTAGAILSIAFGQKVAAVDGNAVRVMSRISGFASIIPPLKMLKVSQALLQEYMCETAPGDFNQSIMELGATLCTPRSPSCIHCPVNMVCRAYRSRAGNVLSIEASESKRQQHPGGDFDFVPACHMATGAFCAVCSSSPLSMSPKIGTRVSDFAQESKGRALARRRIPRVGNAEAGSEDEGAAEWEAERSVCSRKKICKERPTAYYEALVFFVGNQKEGPRELLLRQRPPTGLLAGEWGPILLPQDPFPLTEGTVRSGSSVSAIWKRSLPDRCPDVEDSQIHIAQDETPQSGIKNEVPFDRKKADDHISDERKSDERWSIAVTDRQRRTVLGTMRHIFSHVTHYVTVSCVGFGDRKEAEQALVGLAQAPLRWIPCSGDRTQWVRASGCVSTYMRKMLDIFATQVVDFSVPTKKVERVQQRCLNTGVSRVTRRLEWVATASNVVKHIKDEEMSLDVSSSVEA